MIKYRWVYCGYCESPIAFADTWDKLFCALLTSEVVT